MNNYEILFYNGNAEPAGYELLEIDPNGKTKEQIKKEIIKLMKRKYQLEWEEYEDNIYFLDINCLKRFREK